MGESDAVRNVAELAEGLGLLLSTQSFAVRALLGSLAAAALVALAIRLRLVRSGRARRVLLLAPITTAATAAVASIGEQFLPPLLVVTQEATDQVFEVFDAEFSVRRAEYLLVVYAAVAAFLVTRRLLGVATVRRLVQRSIPTRDPALRATTRRLATTMRLGSPEVRLLPGCPGGAFTAGIRRPVIVVDPQLLARLDDGEVQGLIAHELAHIARRDVLLSVATGLIRDLTFFLPPLHVACRWLRSEQERNADDLASAHTHRPGALASSILKVYEGARRVRAPGMACATMVPALGRLRPAVAAGPDVPARPLKGTAREVAERVTRLIEGDGVVSAVRQRWELLLVVVVTVLAAATAVVLPAQIDGSLLFAQWSLPVAGPAATVAESPAFATFRAVAQAEPVEAVDVATTVGTRHCGDCLLAESRAEWQAGRAALPPLRSQGWGPTDRFMWEDPPAAATAASTARTARPLWALDGSGSQLGFFLVTESTA